MADANSLKALLFVILLHCNLCNKAQVSFGINSGVGVGFNAPESFRPKTVYNFCTGEDKKKYAVFVIEGRLYFKRSEDSGRSWSDSTLMYSLPCAPSTMVNSRRVDTEPRVACDVSGGPFHKRIYAVWSDLKNGKNNLDVFMVFSDDEGLHWTEPLLLSYHPNHKHQFFPDVLVDPKSGNVYVLYVDQQNFLEQGQCDIQLATSTNGGLQFNWRVMNSEPLRFSGSLSPKLNLRAEGISASWDAKIRSCFLENPPPSERGKSGILLESKSYTYTKNLSISFELLKDSKISAELSKPLEPNFHKILLKRKKFSKGKHNIQLAAVFAKLPEDNYIITLYDEQGNTFAWITQN